MNPALAGVAAAVLVGAVLAVAARDGRTVVVALGIGWVTGRLERRVAAAGAGS